MPVDTHDDIMPATGVVNPNGVETHEDIKPAMGMTAYHGSPHEFDQFDIGKIGTGEGAQAYGHGLYFAENEGVAKSYRDRLSGHPVGASNEDLFKDMDWIDNSQKLLMKWLIKNATDIGLTGDAALKYAADKLNNMASGLSVPGKRQQYYDAANALYDIRGKDWKIDPGHMYEVRLNAEPEHLLDWDEPLSEQPAYQAVRKHWDDKVGDPDIILKRLDIGDESTGRDLYEALGGGRRNAENASKALSDMGIRGIRYLDAGSRGKDGKTGTRNYVIFDPKHIQTVRRYAEGGGIKAYFMHAPREMGERLQRAFGGGITPIELNDNNLEDEARRLILWSYAVAPLGRPLARAEGGAASDPVDKAASIVGASAPANAQNAVNIARNLTPMGFYSAAAEAASKIPQRAPIDQIINKVKGSPNVKAEELDWSGVRGAFSGQKSVDPAQVAQHLQANLPQIQETVYGYDPKTKMKTALKPRYEDYATPGGQNYREVLLHLPEQGQGDYQSSHWGQYGAGNPAVKNIIAHLRMTDRGMKGLGNPEALHIEEVQSDWGQSGRDGGFRKAGEKGGLSRDEEAEYLRLHSMAGSDRTEEQQNRLDELLDRWNKSDEQVPFGPHVTSTEGWTDLALKRALLEAAKGKYRKLTWTPGEEQAGRYGLDKSFSQIHYSPDTKHLFAKGKGDVDDINMNVHEGALSSFIGKELAEKLLARPTIDNTQPWVKGDTVKSLIGGQLAVPQKGMRDFYDRMIPNRLQKLVSKLDPEAKVQLYGHKIDVPGENYPSDANDWKGDEDDWDFKKVHSLEITPKLRAAILKGLPAYEHGGSVVKRAFKVLSKYPR